MKENHKHLLLVELNLKQCLKEIITQKGNNKISNHTESGRKNKGKSRNLVSTINYPPHEFFKSYVMIETKIIIPFGIHDDDILKYEG